MNEKLSQEQLDEVNGGSIYKINGHGDDLTISFSPSVSHGDISKLSKLMEQGNSKEQIFMALHNASEKARSSGSFPMYQHIDKTALAFDARGWKDFCKQNGFER